MNIWSIVVVVLYTLSLGMDLAKHGQQRSGKYNFWASCGQAIDWGTYK